MISITQATADDALAIMELMNLNITEGTALWNEEPVQQQSAHQWICARQSAGRPVLIARMGGAFAGYASYAPYREKSGYRWTMEHSVYVTPPAQGQGVARALMDALITHARASKVHALIGAIEAENHASIAMHQNLGFREVGRLPEVGVKFGRWLDLLLMQLTLDPGAAPR